MNVSESFVPTTDKVARANLCAPFVESGRVYLLEGAAWVTMFLDEVAGFPNAPHDDIVDDLTMAIINIDKESSGEGILQMRSI
jgi:predicted phage terminase large subunit-like protein